MDHPEGLGSASASEVPAHPPGSGYNFRPRSRSATAPKNRRLGSVELQGVGSALDLPAITPPNSPTPRGTGNSTRDNEIYTRPTGNTQTLPVPVDAHDRPILHDMAVKNNEKLAGKNNMATTHDVDDSTKLSQANPLLGLVLETRPISSDVTADNRPEQPLGFKAARDRLDGNESYMVVNRAQNATLVAAKSVCLDTPDLDRTAQWIADSQSTAPPPNPGRVRYTSGSSSSDSSLSPPAMTAHQLGSQPQPRRKPPSSRSSHRSSVSRQSIDLLALTNRLADTTDSAIHMQQRLADTADSAIQMQ